MTAAVDYPSEKKNLSRIGICLAVFSAVFMLIQIIVSIAAVNLSEDTINRFGFIISMLPSYIVCLPLVMFMMKKLAVPSEKTKEPFTVKNLLCAFLVCEAFTYTGNIIGNILSTLLAFIPGINNNNTLVSLLNATDIAQSFIVVGILAPIAEELVFRKTLIDKLGRYGDKTAIIVSAAAFALFHGNIIQFVYAFFMGIIFGYIYRRSGNIINTMILHILININGSVISMIVVQKSRILEFTQLMSGETMPSEEVMMEYMDGIGIYAVYMLLILGMVIAGFIIFALNIKKIVLKDGEVKLEKGKRFSTVALNAGGMIYIIMWLAMMVHTMLQIQAV